MKIRRVLITLCYLVLLGVACSQARTTPVFRSTNTPQPATPTLSDASKTVATPTVTHRPSPSAQPTSSPTSASPSLIPPTSERVQVEPTPISASPTPQRAFPPAIDLEPVLTGLKNLVYLTYASEEPPWDSRLLVVEKAGRILVVENGQVQPIPLLDITDRVGSSGSEQGLLSVAFPPDFAASTMFFVNYTDKRGDTVVARYRLLETTPAQGDATSEQRFLEIAQPAGNHNGGQLQFGPDGYLYIGTGDGGRADDPWGNAQNPEVLLGKMLRVDVTGSDTLMIPSDNPFVDWPNVRPEIWALGLRNPWRFSFDRVSGDLYIADVGQNTYEEVNIQPTQSSGGENYGWDIIEGNHCFEPNRDCDYTGLTLPVAEYDHSQGCSITGGYVYRGTRYPMMDGVYFFGDFCTGQIWGLQRASSEEWHVALLLDTDVSISSFGQDAAGEVYVLDYRDGTIYLLTALP